MDRNGLTLPELLIWLLLIGVATQIAVGPARRQADRMVLVGAREELIALFHRARMEARNQGESRILFATGADPILLVLPDRPTIRVPLASRGVETEVSGARESVEFVYGPLGVAQFASATLSLRRGGEELSVVISGYGRIRR